MADRFGVRAVAARRGVALLDDPRPVLRELRFAPACDDRDVSDGFLRGDVGMTEGRVQGLYLPSAPRLSGLRTSAATSFRGAFATSLREAVGRLICASLTKNVSRTRLLCSTLEVEGCSLVAKVRCHVRKQNLEIRLELSG